MLAQGVLNNGRGGWPHTQVWWHRSEAWERRRGLARPGGPSARWDAVLATDPGAPGKARFLAGVRTRGGTHADLEYCGRLEQLDPAGRGYRPGAYPRCPGRPSAMICGGGLS